MCCRRLFPDETYKMMEEYINNDKIHYIRLNENGGVNIARNRGMDYLLSDDVNCDYITWLDDDDYFNENTLKESVEQIKLTNVNWLVLNKILPSNELITKVERYGYNHYLYDYLSGLNMNGDATMIMSQDLIGNFRLEERVNAREYLFFLKLSQKSNMYVVDFNSTVCEYLEDGMTNSKSKKISSKLKKELKKKTRDIEIDNLHKLNMTYEELEYIKLNGMLLNSIKTKKYKSVLRYFRKLTILIIRLILNKRSNL
jgi:glycosyltransferase involved in cell wall biosynthesis